MDDLLYLKHTTTFDNLLRILQSGKIYTRVDMWYNEHESIGGFTEGGWGPDSSPDQYPGLYMTLIHRDLIGKDIEYWSKDDVQLIFCITLLNRQDFHYNYVDSNGFLNKDITSLNIKELENDIKKRGIIPLNEIIFHNSVSVKYLKEIWVKSADVYTKLQSIFDELSVNIPIKIINKYTDTSYKCDEEINKMTPNYCYFFDKWERENIKESGYPYDIEWYKEMAKKCGLSPKELEGLYSTNPKIIEDLLEKKLISSKISKDEIKEYLLINNVSKDTVNNLSIKQLNQIKNMNLVGLNFLKHFSRFDNERSKDKFVFFSESINKEPGFGIGETKLTHFKYEYLKKTDNWRRMLSNSYVSSFELDNNVWNSVEHFFNAIKFRNDKIPSKEYEFYKTFTLNSKSPWCKIPVLAKKAGQAGKLGFTANIDGIKIPEDVRMRPDFYNENIYSKLQTLAFFAKFSQNPELKKVLLATGTAELWHFPDPEKTGGNILFKELMKVRECIRKFENYDLSTISKFSTAIVTKILA